MTSSARQLHRATTTISTVVPRTTRLKIVADCIIEVQVVCFMTVRMVVHVVV